VPRPIQSLRLLKMLNVTDRAGLFDPDHSIVSPQEVVLPPTRDVVGDGIVKMKTSRSYMPLPHPAGGIMTDVGHLREPEL
jgi:hypothetical protein